MAGRHRPSTAGRGKDPAKGSGRGWVLLCLVGLAMLWLWPDGSSAAAGADSARQVSGVVVSVERQPVPGRPADESSSQPAAGESWDGPSPPTSGDLEGNTITVPVPKALVHTVNVDDEVALSYSADNPPGTQYAIADHLRGTQLWVLLAAFILAVLAFGRWRGLSALLSLSLTFAIILGFVIPAILDGQPPLAVAIVDSRGDRPLRPLSHPRRGPNNKRGRGGHLGQPVITGLLSVAAVQGYAPHGRRGCCARSPSVNSMGLIFVGFSLAGILIGSLGVLDDVTITRAATVQELATANPGYGVGQLYRAAIRVGRSHIASVISTIVLATRSLAPAPRPCRRPRRSTRKRSSLTSSWPLSSSGAPSAPLA